MMTDFTSKGKNFQRVLEANSLTLWVHNGVWKSNDLARVETLFAAYEPGVMDARVELEELDEYFTRPRVIEDAMRGIITSEHQVKIDRRDALRAVVAGAV